MIEQPMNDQKDNAQTIESAEAQEPPVITQTKDVQTTTLPVKDKEKEKDEEKIEENVEKKELEKDVEMHKEEEKEEEKQVRKVNSRSLTSKKTIDDDEDDDTISIEGPINMDMMSPTKLMEIASAMQYKEHKKIMKAQRKEAQTI
ncbi:uncharacterized protein LOC131073591 [Cryptomeria japonica]|uniref:uncharacterized protein LOC131073591 n=1 Tax=Cryptomeria japonica TaxID=3369 RepID=UPI0027DA247D|nr:uncharacterized protein LOC131073591 [Cryptomeria japonica]